LKVDSRVIDQESTLEGERIAMTVDPTAWAHIMNVLTDLYEDPRTAVLREYSTNARDSHVEAGCPGRPIEVSLPTPLAPFLKIRDFGVGLDDGDIREIYSMYGASTKRGTNDAVGMLGLGCKSGLTYADQFTVSGIKGGTRTDVAVGRDADGAGTMTLLGSYETDEEDGAEVVIPTRAGDDFVDAAAGLFRFWDEGTVLVNGKRPERVGGMWIADDLLLTRDTGDELTVVMGGVPYPTDTPGYRQDGWNLVAFVGIGDVNFTPSREALQMTAKTTAKVREILDREKAEKPAALQKLVEDAETAHEAATVAQRAARMGLNTAPTWRGKLIPEYHQRAKDGLMVTAPPVRKYRQRPFSEAMRVVVGADQVFLVGFEGAKFTPYKRQKLDQWLGKHPQYLNGNAPSEFVVVDAAPETAEWIDPARLLRWEAVEAEKISKARGGGSNGGPRKKAGTYHVYTRGGSVTEMDADAIPTRDLFYVVGSTAWNADQPREARVLMSAAEGATVAILPANRLEKFRREFRTARPAREAAQELADAWAASVTDEDLTALRVKIPAAAADLDPAKIDDPELSAAVASKKRKAEINGQLQRFGGLAKLRAGHGGADFEARYPLLGAIRTWNLPKNDVIIYLNAAFAAKEGNN
jgi:hypothetical protein